MVKMVVLNKEGRAGSLSPSVYTSSTCSAADDKSSGHRSRDQSADGEENGARLRANGMEKAADVKTGSNVERLKRMWEAVDECFDDNDGKSAEREKVMMRRTQKT